MKNLLNILIGLLLLIITGCAGGGRANVDQPAAPNILSEQTNEEEYELIIIDPSYQTWFITNSRPMGYYSPSYYENWNNRYVQAWNEKVNQQGYYRSANYPFQNRIDYDPTIDYGVELNYQLFWYFRYVHATQGRFFGFPGFPAPGV